MSGGAGAWGAVAQQEFDAAEGRGNAAGAAPRRGRRRGRRSQQDGAALSRAGATHCCIETWRTISRGPGSTATQLVRPPRRRSASEKLVVVFGTTLSSEQEVPRAGRAAPQKIQPPARTSPELLDRLCVVPTAPISALSQFCVAKAVRRQVGAKKSGLCMRRAVESLGALTGRPRLKILQWNVLAEGLAEEGDFSRVRRTSATMSVTFPPTHQILLHFAVASGTEGRSPVATSFSLDFGGGRGGKRRRRVPGGAQPLSGACQRAHCAGLRGPVP